MADCAAPPMAKIGFVHTPREHWRAAILDALTPKGSSVALPGFGLDRFIEIATSTIVPWEISGLAKCVSDALRG
jgi:hypothetical protein